MLFYLSKLGQGWSGPVKDETKIKQLSTAQTKQQQYHSIYVYDVA